MDYKEQRQQDKKQYEEYWKQYKFGALAKVNPPRYLNPAQKKQPKFQKRKIDSPNVQLMPTFKPKFIPSKPIKFSTPQISQKIFHVQEYEENKQEEQSKQQKNKFKISRLNQGFTDLSLDDQRPIRPLKHPLIIPPSLEDEQLDQDQFQQQTLGSYQFMRMFQRQLQFESDAIPAETFLVDQAHRMEEGNHKPLKKKKMKKIPILKVGDDMLKFDCSICYMEFKKGESYMKLKCEHMFHPDCIKKWFKTREICPNCRTNLG